MDYSSNSFKSLIVLTVLLLSGMLATQKGNLPVARANPLSGPDPNSEYSNGTLHSDWGSIWYDWVNTSETQVIYYALYSNVVNSPIINFLGQHFEISNGTEVFVGSTMAMIEVYNDTNGDGIPQANFTAGTSEIAYYLLMNSSVGYQITPIQKKIEGSTAHYRWGFKYETIDGYLLYPEDQPGHGAARVIIDHLGLGYDFYVVENVSSLKTSFDIGQIVDIQPLAGEPPISLDGLSLSLLFTTSAIATRPYATYVDGHEYDSTTTRESATPMSLGQVAVEMIRTYDFVFGGTYNLTRGETVERHDVKSEAAATSSVSESARSSMDWILRIFEGKLNLTDLFGGEWEPINLKCNATSLLYRICYPIWDGLKIEHDPIFIGYLFSATEIPEIPAMVLPTTIAAISIAALVAKRLKRQPFRKRL